MSTQSVVVFGAGGHGKVVADALLTAGTPVRGFLDDAQTSHRPLGLPVLGDTTWLTANPGSLVALGIGNNAVRERVAEKCLRAGAQLVSAIHPRAVIAPSARIEPGAVVFALAVVNPDVIIRKGAIINTGAIVEHDCEVGEYSHVSPNGVLGGRCRIGARSQLGIAATMLPGTSVGDDTLVGGAALVTKSIGNGVIVVGIPGRERVKP